MMTPSNVLRFLVLVSRIGSAAALSAPARIFLVGDSDMAPESGDGAGFCALVTTLTRRSFPRRFRSQSSC